MKIINVHNYNASDVSQQVVELPSESEMAVASLFNNDGTSMIELWFDGDSKMFNSARTAVRDRSSTRVLEIVQAGSGVVREFVEFGASTGFKTAAGRMPFTRYQEGEWTIAAVVQLGSEVAPTLNRSLMGRLSGDESSINPPSLNITGSGVARIIGGTASNDIVVSYDVTTDADIMATPVLLVASQSERNGGTLRVNGALKASNTDAVAKRPSTGADLNLLGSDFTSASWEGIVGSLLLLNKDISDNEHALAVIEGHLSGKFGI